MRTKKLEQLPRTQGLGRGRFLFRQKCLSSTSNEIFCFLKSTQRKVRNCCLKSVLNGWWKEWWWKKKLYFHVHIILFNLTFKISRTQNIWEDFSSSFNTPKKLQSTDHVHMKLIFLYKQNCFMSSLVKKLIYFLSGHPKVWKNLMLQTTEFAMLY